MLINESSAISNNAWSIGSPAWHESKNRQSALSDRMTELEKEQNRIGANREVLLQTIRAHFKEYAAPRCRAFCDEIQAKLPRELRYMVWEYVLGNPHHSIKDEFHPPQMSFREMGPRGPSWVEEIRTRSFWHCFEETFVGMETLYEIVETWYRVAVFKICRLALLPQFLRADNWCCGLAVRDSIRNVQLVIRLDSIRGIIIGKQLCMGALTTTYKFPMNPDIRELFNLSTRTQITLVIEKRGWNWNRAAMLEKRRPGEDSAMFLFLYIKKLRDLGYTVSVNAWLQRALEDVTIRKEEMADDVLLPKITSILKRL